MATRLFASPSPHIHSADNTRRIMGDVVLALIPALAVSTYVLGLRVLFVTFVAVASCVLFEYLISRLFLKRKATIGDLSAVVTGVLLAFNLPVGIPWWIVVIGALVAIGIGKMSFGGLGNNPFNPALVGRVFMLISFPVAMTTWPTPNPIFSDTVLDAVTGPTLLGHIKEGLAQGIAANDLIIYEDIKGFIYSGSLGEIGSIAIIIGGLFLIIRKVIDWQTPVIIIATVAIISTICWLIDPVQFVNPLIHIFGGGLMLGAFFMATDYVTSPMSAWGKIIFGIGIGFIVMVIRTWGAYPEGMSFAILIMNACVPLLNKIRPRRFGEKKKA